MQWIIYVILMIMRALQITGNFSLDLVIYK